MACPVCGIKLPKDHKNFLPCGVAPRVYVNEWGLIVGYIQGCPYEANKIPDYLPYDIIPRMEKGRKKKIQERSKGIANAQGYQDLWTARYRQNYHLNFDAQKRLGIWYAANSGSLHNTHKGRVRGSKTESG